MATAVSRRKDYTTNFPQKAETSRHKHNEDEERKLSAQLIPRLTSPCRGNLFEFFVAKVDEGYTIYSALTPPSPHTYTQDN